MFPEIKWLNIQKHNEMSYVQNDQLLWNRPSPIRIESRQFRIESYCCIIQNVLFDLFKSEIFFYIVVLKVSIAKE